MTFARALCIGEHDLFDSTDPRDHAQAGEICRDCPVLATCTTRLLQLVADGVPHLQGTWAGQLLAGPRDRARIAAEEVGYSEEEARRAHTRYTLGDKSDWARVGHRVYCRRVARRRRTGSAA